MTGLATAPDAASSAVAELTGAELPVITLRAHDASHLEWAIALPLPRERRLAYEIEVEFDIPASAAMREAPWDLLQVFTRLEGPAEIASSSDASVDELRRRTVALVRMLVRAKEGFARHCHSAAANGGVPELGGQPFLTVWLDAALRLVREARTKLTRPADGDTAQVAVERALIDEFVSVRLLEMLAEGERCAHVSTAAALEVRAAFAELRERIAEVLRGEAAYREQRGFLRAEADLPQSLERYLARAAQLKKHFEEVLFLDRESEQLEERLQLWSRVAGALLGGVVATLPLQLVLAHRPAAGEVGFGVLAIALISGATYALREHIKESGRSWLTGKMVRFQTQRLSRCRVPAGRMATRGLVLEAREWCRQLIRARPDPLNPEGGASLRVMQIHYLHRGKIHPHEELWAAGVRRVLHIFRYDLSPLLPRLDDEPKPVPVTSAAGEVRFLDVARSYRVPIAVRVDVAGVRHEQRAVLVLDRAGVRRLSLEGAARPRQPSGAD